MRQITFTLAALSLAGATGAVQAQEIRYSTQSPAVAIASSIGGSSLGKLGLSVSSGSERDTLGLLVVRIDSDGPAEKAGLVEGDRITAVNGTSLTLSAADAGEPDMALILRRRLERTLEKVEPNQEVTLRVWSSGRTREVKVRAGEERRATRVADVYGTYVTTARSGADRPVIGVSLGASGTKRDTLGVFIAGVVEGGPAEQAGIFEGHRIASINGVDLRVPAADASDAMVASARANRLQRELEKVEPGTRVQLRVWSDGRYRDVTVEVKRQSEVYKESGAVRIGGVGTLNSFGAPNVIVRTLPSTVTLEPSRGRVQSLDSLWRHRDEIRRTVDPRFQRDTSGTGAAGSGQGGVYQFRMDDAIREAMERARIEMERARQLVPGTVIRTRTSA